MSGKVALVTGGARVMNLKRGYVLPGQVQVAAFPQETGLGTANPTINGIPAEEYYAQRKRKEEEKARRLTRLGGTGCAGRPIPRGIQKHTGTTPAVKPKATTATDHTATALRGTGPRVVRATAASLLSAEDLAALKAKFGS